MTKHSPIDVDVFFSNVHRGWLSKQMFRCNEHIDIVFRLHGERIHVPKQENETKKFIITI